MTQILPKVAGEFADPAYWRQFYSKRQSPFEWYGDYNELGSILEKYLKVSDKMLQIGCGNSKLAASLYDNGYRNVHSVDIDEKIIKDQIRVNKARTELTFDMDDATTLATVGDDSYNVVLDKGTLDALYPPQSSDTQKDMVDRMFNSVHRVVQANGRYIIVSLAQEHIVRKWVEFFSAKNQYILRAQGYPTHVSSFPMPVFLLVATKLRMPMPTSLPIEIYRPNAAKADKTSSTDELMSSILAEQELSRIVHLCNKKLEYDVSFDIISSDGLSPRYKLHFVDRDQATDIKSLVAFVVPLGRESEWIFCSPKGRQTIMTQMQKDRIIFIFMFRGQTYDDFDQVKDELAPFIFRFKPQCQDTPVDFVTIGDIDVTKMVAEGLSKVNGPWRVEDVAYDGRNFRRLIFLNSSNITQSEAFLKSKKNKTTVDLDHLTCSHHIQMVAGLAMLQQNPLISPDNANLKLTVLGLGGGLLASFLLRKFPKSTVCGVELDEEVAKIASDHFGFPATDSRVTVRVMDALKHLEESATQKDKLDVLFVDVAGSHHDDGLSCPPAAFLDDTVLDNMRKSLKQDGLLALNVLTRDKEKLENIKKDVKKIFPNLYSLHFDVDLNEVLLGFSESQKQTRNVRDIASSLSDKVDWIKNLKPAVCAIKRVD